MLPAQNESSPLQKAHDTKTVVLKKLSFKWTRNIVLDFTKLNLCADDKYQICHIWHEAYDPNDPSTSAAEFARSHGINYKTQNDWKKAYKVLIESGIKKLRDNGGRPRSIDKASLENLLKTTKAGELQQHPPSRKRFREEFHQEQTESLSRRGVVGEIAPKCCSRTIRNYIKEHFAVVNPQLET